MKALILWMDALDASYLSRQRMPFLQSLLDGHGLGSVPKPFGYANVPATFYSGKTLAEHRQLNVYANGPEKIRGIVSAFLPRPLDAYYFSLQRFYAGHTNVVPFIGLNKARGFSLSQERFISEPGSLPVPTVFDSLRVQGTSFVCHNWPVIGTEQGVSLEFSATTDAARARTAERLLSLDKDVYFFHFWDLDHSGHALGPDPDALASTLRAQDALIERLVSRAQKEGAPFLLWSDHGMVPVTGPTDIGEPLQRLHGVKHFLDSTMARFWVNDEAQRNALFEAFNGVEGGRFLSTREKNALQLDRVPEAGHEFFCVSPGRVLSPNFFDHGPVKGMHGYNPFDVKEECLFVSDALPGREVKALEAVLPKFLRAASVLSAAKE
ncbi:MAG: alkaline phosphatase family protein [Candidatus Diapherotrites archaeon]|uniref:Alkaline phosphatase family protein n=1 Tax=Candidatus Iainarchaeum sp. TaxID=3101447 RepID=A0A8T4LG97_9ARCH|nr:alkaline phosphatase family protein [Candidatus Diapherotrites archaeon]